MKDKTRRPLIVLSVVSYVLAFLALGMAYATLSKTTMMILTCPRVFFEAVASKLVVQKAGSISQGKQREIFGATLAAVAFAVAAVLAVVLTLLPIESKDKSFLLVAIVEFTALTIGQIWQVL